MSELRTRKPTGLVAYPFILVEGEEKAGKTYLSLALSASPKVGRSFVIELDEPTADEYAALGDFDIVEHNGTYTAILEAVESVIAVPTVDGKPNVLILDTGTALWDLLKDWTSGRARNSKRAQKLLADDPDADIDVSANYWNDAKDRWYRIMNRLRQWEGIAVIVARGKEVTKFKDGQPVAGQTEWSTQIEKGTPYAVSAVVRVTRPHRAVLMSVRSLAVDVPVKGLPLPDQGVLEHLVFDILAAGGGGFQASPAVTPSQGITIADAKKRLVEIFARSMGDGEAKLAAKAVWEETAKDAHGEVTVDEWSRIAAAAADRIASPATPNLPPAQPPAGTPDDPEAWYTANGWASKAEHDDAIGALPVVAGGIHTAMTLTQFNAAVETAASGAEKAPGEPTPTPDVQGAPQDATAPDPDEPVMPACVICGSTRANRVQVHDKTRCQDATGCAKRVADKASGQESLTPEVDA